MMSVGSSSVDAIRRRVLEIVADNEDIDALLKECLPERANDVYSADCLPYAVDGILTNLENQCILSGCSLSILSASVFGDRLKKLVSAVDHQLLLDESLRSHFSVLVETCKQLLERNVFNRKLFAKSVNKDTVLPLEVIWRLEKESLMSLDLFITSNLSRPSVIGGLAQNVATLCSAKDGETDELMRLRIEIVTDLLVSLLSLTYGTDMTDDVTARGVRKVSSALLDSITKKLVQLEGLRRDVNIFEKLLVRRPALDGRMLKKYVTRQLTVILSSSAVFKVSDALSQQNSWTFHVMDKFHRSIYEQLLTVFDASEVIELMQRLLEQNEVNWRTLLSFVSVLLICENDARALFSGFVESLLKEAMNSLNLDKIITAMLLGRHGCLEGPHVFMSYQHWFQKMFGDANSSLCNSRKSFSFLMKFLTDIVPHEHAAYLQVHLQKPPFIPAKCRPLWSDYATIAKTRLIDLKASTDDVSVLGGDGSRSVDPDRTSLIETDIEKAVSTFEKNLKIPVSILEASIFKKSYFTGMFLPILLQPRPLPSAPDMKMKFIEALHRAGKIPDVQFAEYKEKCRTLTEQLLEGIFDVDGEGDDEFLSLDEQLHQSLASFRDIVLEGHLETKEVDRQIAAVSEKLFAVTKRDATVIGVASQDVVVNVEEASLSRENVRIAREVLDIICQISSAQPDSGLSWLNSFLLMLFRHPAVLQSMCVVIFHLLKDQGTRLVSCHIPGLAAVLARWTMSNNFSKHLVVHSKAGNQMSFVSHVLDSLPMVSSKSMRFSLEFAVEFLHRSDSIFKSSMENETVKDMEVEKEDSNRAGIAGDDETNVSVVPEQILRIVEYAGPRMFRQLRLAHGCREVKKYQEWKNGSGMDPLLKSLLDVISVEGTRLCLRQSEMTFREWVEREMRAFDEDAPGDRIGYYDWVVFVCRYRHSESEESVEVGVYVEMCCATLINAMIDFEVERKGNRSKHDEHGEMRKVELSEISGNVIRTSLFQLVQKLVLYLDRLPKAANSNQFWLWNVLEARWKEPEKSEYPGTRTRLESEVSTFSEMLLLLPSGVLLPDTSTCLLNDETIRTSTTKLLWFVNEIAKNFTNDGLSLPPSIARHLFEAIAILPPSCNGEIARLLTECPLLISSMILNWPAVCHLRYMMTSETTFSSVFEETERLIQGTEGIAYRKSLDAKWWMKGLAAFAQIRAGRDATALTSRLSREGHSVLHECMIVEVAVEVLHEKPRHSPPEGLLRLYEANPDLQCLIPKPIMAKFDLCTSYAVQQILPLVRVYVFAAARERNLLSGFSSSPLNFEFIVSNYNEASKLYDSSPGEQWTLFDQRTAVEILRAASAGILAMINAATVELLKTVDPVLFTDSDLQLKAAYSKRLLEN